ncbi:hypothetical protein OB236_13955 [Paenibacillus sp. WQ 127069]|uniref:Uncharacterized protein n=1 Tax=Paenibacillus baimaensis TaxID=2982185 RepID=A0ABT2UF34_9BACL|nr:hypothetical protein [Paenibacillus sp. WQ 127069]MCU6793222.1 hypothetical protein [Paenibacillus sp. WQ 127069]
MEHTLRLAVLDPINNGLQRKLSDTQLNKYQSISALLKAPNINLIIPDPKDRDWWVQVASRLRNKSTHFIIPTLLKLFTGKDYHPSDYILTNDDGTPKHDLLHDWGSFFHKSDNYIAIRFFNESSEQLQKIITNTQWKSDLTWWKSQEEYYNMFFNFKWNIESMKESLNNMYVDLLDRRKKDSVSELEEDSNIN